MNEADRKRYAELKATPYFVARELGPDRWRASTDKGYLHASTEAELKGMYAALGVEVGDRVRALGFCPTGALDDNVTVPPGTEGTVSHVDDEQTIHVKWDNGRTLGLLSGLDKWERV